MEVKVSTSTWFPSASTARRSRPVPGTDLVEDPDGEDKLGQPLASVAYNGKLGRWEVFLLPFFRERSFPGSRGRLRTVPVVDTRTSRPGRPGGLDWAARWSSSLGAWDLE